jgi:hypothetical protein
MRRDTIICADGYDLIRCPWSDLQLPSLYVHCRQKGNIGDLRSIGIAL